MTFKQNLCLQLTRLQAASMYDGRMTAIKDGLQVLIEFALSKVVTFFAIANCFPAKFKHPEP